MNCAGIKINPPTRGPGDVFQRFRGTSQDLMSASTESCALCQTSVFVCGAKTAQAKQRDSSNPRNTDFFKAIISEKHYI